MNLIKRYKICLKMVTFKTIARNLLQDSELCFKVVLGAGSKIFSCSFNFAPGPLKTLGGLECSLHNPWNINMKCQKTAKT